MTNETFTDRLREVADRIHDLSPEQREVLEPLLEEIEEWLVLLRENIAPAQAALDEWRIYVKYALFDRDARRRERRH